MSQKAFTATDGRNVIGAGSGVCPCGLQYYQLTSCHSGMLMVLATFVIIVGHSMSPHGNQMRGNGVPKLFDGSCQPTFVETPPSWPSCQRSWYGMIRKDCIVMWYGLLRLYNVVLGGVISPCVIAPPATLDGRTFSQRPLFLCGMTTRLLLLCWVDLSHFV